MYDIRMCEKLWQASPKYCCGWGKKTKTETTSYHRRNSNGMSHDYENSSFSFRHLATILSPFLWHDLATLPSVPCSVKTSTLPLSYQCLVLFIPVSCHILSNDSATFTIMPCHTTPVSSSHQCRVSTFHFLNLIATHKDMKDYERVQSPG